LNVYSFNDDQTNLYARNPNIQLLQCYNDTVPDIQYFLFIKDTEELCFVEKGGQARIFNLINQRFRPAVSKFPSNIANVLSTPDGSCIVAFVKERIYDDEIADNKGKDMCRAYVYFCANFGGSVDKGSFVICIYNNVLPKFNFIDVFLFHFSTVVNLPQNLQSLTFLQFSHMNKLQTHLISFDLQNGYFNSAIVEITMEKTHYRIQERTQKQRVKFVDSSHKNVDYTIVKGKGTQFEKDIQKGQNIVIMGEKYNVIKVLSDTKLKVTGKFKSTSVTDKWTEFYIEPIEPKTKLNNLIDVYRLMFEKYPIENCIDSQNYPLNLKIVLDVDEDNDINEFTEKFEDYVIENLRHSTKKLSTILKKFSTSVITFQKLDIDNVRLLNKCLSNYDLGDWIIKLCCLIPIQIAITRNNSFQPLKDGLSWDEIDRIEFDNGYGHHLDSIAKNISFGWYEGIFKHFGNKKIKVVSIMGERSCETSSMLNHLIGASFDESAMVKHYN
jgi:hypothetical protein